MIANDTTIQKLLDAQSPLLKKEGEVYFYSMPSKDVAIDEKADSQNRKRWSTARVLSFDFIKEQMASVTEGAILLDVGMGQAQFKELYERQVVIGADHYPYADVRVVCDFTQKLPFKDGSLDVIMASNVLEHLPNPDEVMREYHRVLRPGGKIIVAVPFLLGVHQAPYDFYRYTQFALLRISRGAGFSDTQVSILGTGRDAYFQMQDKFFTLILDSKDRQKMFAGKLVVWILAKLAWTLQRILNAILSPLFSRIGKTMKLPLMYGMVSVK